MKLFRFIIIGFIVIGQSCSRDDENFSEIIRSPEKFDGREIQVSRIYHYQFEDVAIYLDSDSDTNEAMWVNLVGSHDNLHGKRITLKGTFDFNDKGHLGQYVGTIKDAKLIED